MILNIGPIKENARWEGDALAFLEADLLENGEKVGSVHQNGYKPQWAFEINRFRHKYRWDPNVVKANPFEAGSLQRLLFDGAAWDSPEEARDVAQAQLTRFLEKLKSET